MAVGMPEVKDLPAVDLAKNPLAETHEFRQACSICFVKTGKELLESIFPSVWHKCLLRDEVNRLNVGTHSQYFKRHISGKL